MAYLRLISGIYQTYHGHILGISKAYLRYISGKYQAYLRHISGISQVYPRYITGISQSYKSGIPLVYQRHISVIYKSSLTTKYHSIYSYLTLIDTEIFAAYAGSCLFRKRHRNSRKRKFAIFCGTPCSII